MFFSSIGASSSSKKSKDKSGISRSQSQRPAGQQDRWLPSITAASSKVAEDEAETGLGQDSVPDSKTQPEPSCETEGTNTQNIVLCPTAACVDLSPSGGSSAVLQPETCDKLSVSQAESNLNHEETSSAPVSLEKDQTNEDDVSEPKTEGETEAADKGNQKSDSIYW